MWTVNDNPLSEGSGGKRVMGWAVRSSLSLMYGWMGKGMPFLFLLAL